ncbi:MAG: TIGR02757 family protein [Vicinamibacterales bacterium]
MSAVPVGRARQLVLIRGPLEGLYRTFDHVESATDPVHIVRRFRSRADREVAGFCAAALAFGRVASVLQSIEALLKVMGGAPAAFVRAFDPARDAPALGPLVHRWIRGVDLAALMVILQRMLVESGSIERFFLENDDPAAPDVGPGLDAFSRRAMETDLRAVYTAGRGLRRTPGRSGPGVCYFFPRPSAGSACKRLNLFLRWMVRKDAIDLGAWTEVSPSRLVVPLDTHVIRVARCLRLTRYASPGWRMASEITASLRAIDPADPVRYDFSLCHIGMMNACGYGRRQKDTQCPLRGVCRPRGGGRRGRGRAQPL